MSAVRTTQLAACASPRLMAVRRLRSLYFNLLRVGASYVVRMCLIPFVLPNFFFLLLALFQSNVTSGQKFVGCVEGSGNYMNCIMTACVEDCATGDVRRWQRACK
jgi:hypothetical protein